MLEGMSVAVRNLVQSAADPRAMSPTHSARVPSIAAPLDLLGARPHTDVAYLSPAARALAGPEAAAIRAFEPPPPPDGLGLDLRA